MACCGKILKAAKIAEGNLLFLMDKIKALPEKTCRRANSRLVMCRQCENCTWMEWKEFFLWIESNGRKQKFIDEIGDLTGWPLLPKKEYSKGKKLFCRICKCWLPAKSYVNEEQCPLGLWKGLDNG